MSRTKEKTTMKEFIYLDTDYLTSALAQLNNGKILTYSNEGATTSTDESKKTSSSQNTSKVNFGLPKVIGVNLGNDKTSEDSSAFIDIKSAKEIITKTFDDNAFDILLEYIQKSDEVSDSNYKDGDFVVLNNEYKLIDFDFLLTLLGDDFIELYINSAISNNKIEKSKENNFRSAQKKYYKELRKNLERFKKLVPSSTLLYTNNILLPVKKEFLRDSFEDISFKYKRINFLARITRKFEYIKYENDSNMLINAVDYMMPSILKSFHIDIIDNETYIATPIAIYIE